MLIMLHKGKGEEKNMKRMISCLLAVILALAPCLQADALGLDEVDIQVSEDAWADTGETAGREEEGRSAAVNGSEMLDPGELAGEDVQEVPSDGNDSSISGSETPMVEGQAPDAAGSGQVDVVIKSALDLEKQVDFTVKVGEQSQTVTLEPQGKALVPVQTNVVFEGLLAGQHTLTVTAPGFAVYTQDIPVEDSMSSRVQLMTGDVKVSEDVTSHPGVLRIGDVNGDGKIDQHDQDKLIEAIDQGVTDELTDLNGDEKTDLADLEYLAKSYGVETVTSTVERYVSAKSVSVSHNEVNIIEGAIGNILTNQGGPVKFSPKNGNNISSENPVELNFDLDDKNEINGILIETGLEENDPGTDAPEEKNTITQADFTIVYEDNGQEKVAICHYDETQQGIHYMLKDNSAAQLGVTVSRDASGALCLDLGAQVPVKKVTLKIIGVKKNNNLAEISKVEFVGDLAERIPEPQMDIPDNISIVNDSQAFTATWDPQVNVTGYEVSVVEQGSGAQPYIVRSTGNSLQVTSIGDRKDDKLVNGKKYVIRVQSVNGTWRSGWSKEEIAAPMSTKKPDPPDNLSLTGKYKSIAASWKDMKDTDSYNLYYKKVDGETEYTSITGIQTNKYTITGLEDKVLYEVYVTGCNNIGESGPSLKRQVSTEEMTSIQMPKYKRINEAADGEVSEHIVKATAIGGPWEMKGSPLDTAGGTIWGTIDNDHASYYRVNDWDLGVNYHPDWGLKYIFDKPYKIQDIALHVSEMEGYNPTRATVNYKEEGAQEQRVTVSMQQRADANGKKYFLIRLPKPVTTQELKIGLTTDYSRLITVCEVNFYHYDPLADDITALYQDDLHTVLKENVTQDTIKELRTRLETTDPVSGEYHPDKELLEKELQTAEDILNAVSLNSPARIHMGITTKDSGRGFSGLNAWQPLGITAAAGEKLNVYVGHATKKTGENTGLQLVATQYHSESNGVVTHTSPALKIGRNEITLPMPSSVVAGCESGGALYVQYTGNSANDDYAVRVDGGSAVPVLDLYHVTDKIERQSRTEAYVTQLAAYVGKMQENHEKVHDENIEYDKYNCILGAADILLDTMMLSIPAQQILAGSGSGTDAQRAEKILRSMDAMEEMMHLFYQHKGLNAKAAKQIDQIPKGHLNIRYQRMFAGAFMYASGNHIGIEYGSTSGMVKGEPVQKDENGKWIRGQYFGWGIAHEIGHDINQGAYAVAEITNNYFAVLAQAKDTNDSVRFQYKNVYDKVTSGTKGNAPNVFTQLGMYWQLHLAYDNGYNYKTYDDHAEQLANLFFARMDSYARTPANAPKPDGVALSLSGDSDQKLMRLACAAAEKDILDFFERWGKTPDDQTKAYAAQFEKETRAIYYVNDEARVYRLENTAGSSLKPDGTTQAVGDNTTAEVHASTKNQVDFTFDSKGIPTEDILGYEITRCIRSNGEVEEQPVGFASEFNDFTFSDHVTTINNRVLTYKVTLVDKYLNRSVSKELDPVKIEHDGDIDKTDWTIETAGISTNQVSEIVDQKEDEPLCGQEVKEPITKAIDNDMTTTFEGKVEGNAEVIIHFNKPETVAALRYKAPSGKLIQKYRISILEEGGSWKQVKEGTFGNESEQKVYFDNENGVNGNIGSYKTEAVKLTILDAKGTEFSISEIDVLGITGDNVDFRSDDTGAPAIGILKDDYVYKDGDGTGKIPAGSKVFIGSYKGNPAYNVVMLYDQDGNIVGGTKKEENGEESLNAHQMIFAELPPAGDIQNVSKGTWVYWIEPDETIDMSKLKKVRAELYRVDDALTNEGQRLVSDSYFKEVPTVLPSTTIK